MTVIVEAGPFNGPDDPDVAMSWVDITAYVNDNLQPPTVAIGRQTELQQVNPGSLSLILNNRDHRFTPANPTSPYFPGWRPSMRIRMRETIGYQTFNHFDGNMLQPDVTITTADLDQTVTMNATDRLGRLQQSRMFISTLAEYIIFNGGTSLKGYYPFNETGSPSVFRNNVSGLQPFQLFRNDSTLAPQSTASPGVTFGGGTNPPGDDTRGLLFAPVTVPNGNINAMAKCYQLSTVTVSGSPGGLPRPLIHAGDTLTFVAWVNLDPNYQDANNIFSAQITDVATASNVTQVTLIRDSFINTDPHLGAWVGQVFNFSTGLTGTVVGPIDNGGRTIPVGIQIGYSPNVLTMWIDNLEFTTVPTGSLVDPEYLTLSNNVGFLGGSITHAQIYVGSYTRAQFLAQRNAGHDGLAGQYTGQRVSTIAQYAGVAVGDMDIDAGTSRMQKATLAGRSPLDVMQEAATTEQGLLHAAGRRLLFHDRLRRYNR